MESKRRTVGSEAQKLLALPDQRQPIVDTMEEMAKEFLENLRICVNRYDWKEPFYVCVVAKKERLMENVIRHYFYGRQTRPAPTYDLACFEYNPSTGDLKFHWCIPDADTCAYLMLNGHTLGKEHQDLCEMVKLYSEGKLV